MESVPSKHIAPSWLTRASLQAMCLCSSSLAARSRPSVSPRSPHTRRMAYSLIGSRERERLSEAWPPDQDRAARQGRVAHVPCVLYYTVRPSTESYTRYNTYMLAWLLPQKGVGRGIAWDIPRVPRFDCHFERFDCSLSENFKYSNQRESADST